MEKDDARKLSSAGQHERRKQVIRAHKRGRTRTQIAEEVGLSYTAVSKTIARYEELGAAALAPRTRGRRSGEDRALTQAQEQTIQRTICDKRPEQLKMEFALWSRAAVMELIKREYAVVLHVRSVGKYLKRWGFTPQKPIKRAYEQSAALCGVSTRPQLIHADDARGLTRLAPSGKFPLHEIHDAFRCPHFHQLNHRRTHMFIRSMHRCLLSAANS